jgi:hypothetical protein
MAKFSKVDPKIVEKKFEMKKQIKRTRTYYKVVRIVEFSMLLYVAIKLSPVGHSLPF